MMEERCTSMCNPASLPPAKKQKVEGTAPVGNSSKNSLVVQVKAEAVSEPHPHVFIKQEAAAAGECVAHKLGLGRTKNSSSSSRNQQLLVCCTMPDA